MPYSKVQSGDLDPYMKELASNKLLDFVEPDYVLYPVEEDFNQKFLSIVRGLDLDELKSSQRRIRIHIGKVPHELFVQLEALGLAEAPTEMDTDDWHFWVSVEETTGAAYMAYLAGALAGARDGMVPVTDQRESLTAGIGMNGDSLAKVRNLRAVMIEQALPAPGHVLPVRELLNFKESHGDELRRLRIHLDGILADIAATEDAKLQAVKLKAASDSLADEVNALKEQMLKRRWPKVLIVGVGGLLGTALGTTATVLTGGAALVVGLTIGAGALSAASASHTLTESLGAPRYNARAPMAYAAMVSQLGQ